jgi:putative membrane protein
MLWIKAFHIIFVICWFAGIFYLPRLFVYHAMSEHQPTRDHLLVMEQKLYRFVTPFAYLSIGFGAWLTSFNTDYYFSQTWFWCKIVLVAALLIYHIQCGRYIKRFVAGEEPRSHTFYRWFNEVPVFALFAIVILVVVKPLTN